MRYNKINITFLRDVMVDCHPSESIVDLGSASVDNVSSGWQSTMSPRKKCYIYIMSTRKEGDIIITECPISKKDKCFRITDTCVWDCIVKLKIVFLPFDQSDWWKLTWGIIMVNIAWIVSVDLIGRKNQVILECLISVAAWSKWTFSHVYLIIII